jgi:hypothetical protein
MDRLNRRHFIAAAATVLADLKTFAQGAPQNARLTLHPEKLGPKVPHTFVGLSYEMQQITAPDFFCAKNQELIQQFRALAPQGMLRLGGNTSDAGYWKPSPDAPMPKRQPAHPFGSVKHPDIPFPVTTEGLQRLRGFLDATNWNCIYGINLGTNVPAVAAEEAAAATTILGPHLDCIQIGNEADRYGMTFRRDPKTWGPESYYKEWRTFAEAIIARLPNVRLGMPDLAAKPEWFSYVTNALEQDVIRRNVVTLTYHYYVDGPPSNPLMDIPHMLNANADVMKDAGVVRDAAAKLQTTWRMTEGNSCWNSGKPGVSDVFAAALWSADYMLLHASLGCAGINLHGGDSRLFSTFVGGTLPESTHPSPPYTPISFRNGQYIAEPVSYGMRFAGVFAGATMIPLEFDPGPVTATAYAATSSSGKMILAVINKDASRDIQITLSKARAQVTLRGPALDAQEATITPSSTGAVVPRSSATLFHLA